MKVCPGEMSQNFPIIEPVSEASYSAEIDLEIAIPLSVSLVYRDQGRVFSDTFITSILSWSFQTQ